MAEKQHLNIPGETNTGHWAQWFALFAAPEEVASDTQEIS